MNILSNKGGFIMVLRLVRLLLIAFTLAILGFSILKYLKIELSNKVTNILALVVGILTYIIQQLLKF